MMPPKMPIPISLRQSLYLPAQRDFVIAILAVLLAAVPAIRLLVVGLTTGTNVISGPDFYATSHLPVIDAVLRGHYDWTHFLSDTMGFGTHQLAVEYLIRIALAKFFFWPIAGEVWIAWVATVVRTFAIAAVLAHGLRPRIGAWRWMILPLVSFLAFGGSQVGLVAAPTIGLNFGLPIVGFFVGLWAVVCIRNQRIALVVAVVSSILATFSGAYGLVGWPILGIGLLVYGFSRKYIYVWTGAALISIIIYSLNVNPGGHPEGAHHGFTPFAATFWLKAIGTPLGAESTTTYLAGYAMSIGIFGALAGIIGAIVLLRRRPRIALRESFPALAVLGFAFGCIWLIGSFRGNPHPWYEPIFMIWWQGVVAVIWTICLRRGPVPAVPDDLSASGAGDDTRGWASLLVDTGMVRISVAGIAVLWIITLLYVNSNVDWRQKDKYRKSRSAATSTCAREWRTTVLSSYNECASTVPPTSTVPASVRTRQLEDNHLSVFAPSETRYLQGDWMLPLVSVVASSTPKHRPQWVNDNRHMEVVDYNYTDPELESLTVPGQSKVIWKVRIPSNASEARFRTSFHLSTLPRLPLLVGHGTSGHNGHVRAGYRTRIHISTTRLDGSGLRQQSFDVLANRDRSVDFDLRSFSGGYAQIVIEAGETSIGTTAVMSVPIVTTHTDVKHIPLTDEHLPMAPPSVDDRAVAVGSAEWVAKRTTASDSGGATLWKLKSPDAEILATGIHACMADYQGLLIRFAYSGVDHHATDLGIRVGFLSDRNSWTFLRMPARATNAPQTIYVPIRASGSFTPKYLEQIRLGLRGPSHALKLSSNETIKYIKYPFSGLKIFSLTLAAPYKTGHCERQD